MESNRPEDRSVASKVDTQHRLLESLMKGLVTALDRGDLDRARKKLRSLETAVLAHFELEEDHYFPARREAQPEVGEAIDALRSEHDRMRSDLDAVALHLRQDAQAEARDVARAFASLFHAHEAREREVIGPDEAASDSRSVA